MQKRLRNRDEGSDVNTFSFNVWLQAVFGLFPFVFDGAGIFPAADRLDVPFDLSTHRALRAAGRIYLSADQSRAADGFGNYWLRYLRVANDC